MNFERKTKKSVLIVDDITKNVQILGTILKQADYNTGFATSGQQALRVIDNANFDLILLDIMMPDIDGFAVLKEIRSREKTKDVPVIFLTALNDMETVISGLKMGAQDYITKPFNSDELLTRVATHIDLYDKTNQLKNVNIFLEEKVKERTKELTTLNEKLTLTVQELEIANEKLDKLDQAKSYFLGLLAHELRTPLIGINGNAKLIKLLTNDSEIVESADAILESEARLRKFSELSLLITQLQTEKYDIQIQSDTIYNLIMPSIVANENNYKNKNIELELNLDNEEELIAVDSGLINYVSNIIVDNAIKFSPENSKIFIKGYKDENMYYIVFRDSGQGFSEETLSNIFDYFISDNLLHHSEGHGLSLVAAKIILDLHNAKINVCNLKEGGAEVTISFNIYKETNNFNE